MARIFAKQNLKLIPKLLIQLLKNHFDVLSNQLNPIYRSINQNTPNLQFQQKVHNIVPFLLNIAVVLYGMFGLHFEATGKLPTIQELFTSPYILAHQITPHQIWPQIDFAYQFDNLLILLIFAIFAFLQPAIDSKKKIIFKEDLGKMLIGNICMQFHGAI